MQEDPVSFSGLARRLKISRGSVSENTCLLIEQGIIRRIHLARERGDYFNEDRCAELKDFLEAGEALTRPWPPSFPIYYTPKDVRSAANG